MRSTKGHKRANFSFEKALRRSGYRHIAGVDEVGRGCFAGPVVAACVVFASNPSIPEDVIIDDSKKLTPKERQRADEWIKRNAQAWGIGEAPATLINRVGMGKATKVAFRRAISQAQKKVAIDFLLIDAFYIPWVKGLRRKNQKAIINGDEKSISIAAASIIAKVYRDRLMRAVSRNPKYRQYCWGRNKGYGTKIHQKAIKQIGLTRYHRRAFVETFLNNSSSSQAQSGV